jgi:hypothetical protein
MTEIAAVDDAVDAPLCVLARHTDILSPAEPVAGVRNDAIIGLAAGALRVRG